MQGPEEKMRKGDAASQSKLEQTPALSADYLINTSDLDAKFKLVKASIATTLWRYFHVERKRIEQSGCVMIIIAH